MDFFHCDEFLTEELKMLRDTAREFAEREIAPTQEEDEKEHRFRPEIVRKMAEMGFFGCVIPEEYGGMGLDDGFLASCIITEEIARVSASYGLPFNLQMMGPALTILRYGTEEQKQKYIPRFVNAEIFGCFAITEPNSGSDVASMRSHAVKKGDRYILNGQKTWISGVPTADVGLVYAYTDREAKHRGISCFIVELKNTKGVTMTEITTKLGLFCAPTGEIVFEDVEVPEENLLGKEGDGFKICMSMLDNTRLSCASRAVGVSRRAVEAAAEYALERQQFGRPIAEFQMIQAQLAEMFVKSQAARQLVWRAAKLADMGMRNTLEVSTAKYYAAEAAVHNANLAMKIFGSYGYSTEYPAERLLRDAKSYQVVEGTSNIQLWIVSMYLTGKRQLKR